ncbi:ABC transporter permease [Bacillus sp. AFS041924]|uniref:ABC transporter permease n=1 Tax=Bacillus sp. AFS041924 TaxID=2033503 RepID=UPI000BFDF940|nr:ABC transporter permease [Bacillus sp. AFS041924]PGS50451.1 ABC transporter permease [Bacillus sp. AFS041924]
MQTVFWLISNTLRATFKNKKNVIMYICVPLIGIFISFLAYGGSSKTVVHVGIVNNDHQYIANDTIKFLKHLESVNIEKINKSDVNDKIASGSLDCVISLDNGFTESVRSGNPEHIQITSIKGAQITSFVKSYLYNYIDNISAIGKVAKTDQTKFNQMYSNYQSASFKVSTKTLSDSSQSENMTTYSLGFLIMIMLMSAGNLSEIILKEKENRIYYRLLSAPINARKYIFSNIVVNMIIMTIQVILTLFFMTAVFHIDIHIPFWEAAVVMMLFALIAVGISLMIVAFSNSSKSSGALQNLIVVPTVMISGCFWPIEIMPSSVQRIADFLPQRWTLETLAKLQQGSSLGSLYLNILILLVFAIAFFLIAIYKFSRNSSTRNFV